jgi:CubicO group peptidase (beta-lactamase class C family)
VALASGTAPQAPDRSPPEAVRGRLSEDVAAGRLPGGAVARIARDGTRWELVAGVADLGTRQPVTPNTLFRTGSLAKVVLAIAVMRLVDEGKVSLEAPIRELLPELPLENRWAADAPVTVAHLLEHSAGLEGAHFDEVMVRGPGPLPRPGEILTRRPERLRTRWRPGSRPAYNNRGYVVIAHLLEKIHGEPYEAVLRRRVLEPLGMEHACFEAEPRAAAPRACGYLDEKGTEASEEAAWFRPGADLVASLRDVAAMVRFFLARGRGPSGARVLSESSVARMERPSTTPAARLGLRVGAGPGIGVRARRGRLGFGHYGGGYGFMATFRYFPQEGEGYAIVVNTSQSWDGLVRLQDLLVEAYLPPGAGPPAKPLPDPVPWLGVYRHANSWYPPLEFLEELLGWQWIRRSGDGLVAWGPARGSTELVHLGEGRLRRPGEGAATLAFDQGPEGTRLVGGDVHFVRAPWGWPVVRLALLLLAALALAGQLVVAVVRREGGVAALSTLLLAGGLGLGAGLDYHDLGMRSPRALALCGLSWSYAAAALVAVLQGLRQSGVWTRLGGLAHLVWVVNLAAEGLVGIRTWAD